MRLVGVALALGVHARALAAQTDYYNLDAGRPNRIEDAVPTERHEFDLQLVPFRVERIPGGALRWRAEPKLTYGILPRTELEVRVPMVYRESGVTPRAGLAGSAIGLLHQLLIETSSRPALAAAVEVTLPSGSAAPPDVTVSAKALATRTFGFGRIHLNALYGNYSALVPPPPPVTPTCSAFGGPGCPAQPPIDFPCATAPGPNEDGGPIASHTCMGAAATEAAQVILADKVRGAHWLAGLGIDRTVALQSLLVTADAFAERYEGLGRPTDVTIEVGLRKQLGPRSVVDVGVARRVAGLTRSSFLTFGSSYAFALRRLMRVR